MSRDENHSVPEDHTLSSAVRALILGFFAIVLAVVSVSFAIHHMREGFESEYRKQFNLQLKALATNAMLVIDGDEIEADPVAAGMKYPAIINLMLPSPSENSFSQIDYGIFACYGQGTLAILHISDDQNLVYIETAINKWNNSNPEPYEIETKEKNSLLIPILNSQGVIVGLFEITGSHSSLRQYGDVLEGKLLLAVIVSALLGLLLFSVQYFVPKVLTLLRKREVNKE